MFLEAILGGVVVTGLAVALWYRGKRARQRAAPTVSPKPNEPAAEPEIRLKATCYACPAPATTKEHAPPKCFFPEKKDLPERDRRMNLITVPSCEQHNTAASKDDEYTLAVLAAAAENNEVAMRLYGTKIQRALEKPTGLLAKVIDGWEVVEADGQRTRALKVDRARIERTMAKAARAVHFHEFGVKWAEEVRVESSALCDDTFLPSEEHDRLDGLLDTLLMSVPKKGANPDVFQYQALRDPELGFTVMRLTLYEGLRITVLSGQGLEGAFGPDDNGSGPPPSG